MTCSSYRLIASRKMKQRLQLLIKFFLIIFITFIVMKIVFMLYNRNDAGFAFGDVMEVIAHGAPLDLTTTAYLCIWPWLLCVLSVWTSGNWTRKAFRIYAWVVGIVMAIFLVTDCVLYNFWQYKIDATILVYIDRPADVLASISALYAVGGVLLIAVLAAIIVFTSYRISRRPVDKCHTRYLTIIVFVLIGGLMFLAIRGGIGKSTMNVGHVYYSSNQFPNHSAVNPLFNFCYSALKYQDFDDLYRYFPEEECDKNFAELQYSTQSIDCDSLLNTQTPNVVIVLMEGMGATFIEALGGEKGVTPNFNKLCEEGVLFTQCYANSYRTDRGMVCALSGYPSFPEISVMKIPEKSQDIPSIAESLAANGYETSFLYGGDINFTNTNSFLMSAGYTDIQSDINFPVEVRTTHSWGVTDHIVLDTLCNQIMRQPAGKPFFKTCLTLASHEDWNVPYHRINGNPKANSMAYLDDCIGKLVGKLKQSPAWDNLLLVFLPDHGISYPPGNTESDIARYHIPILWVGGAVKNPTKINKICNQTDLAATLLGQLGISHEKLAFSRDVTSKTYTYPCAVHSFSGGITFIDSTGVTVQDLKSGKMLVETPKASANRIRYARTLLQKQINDFADR